MKRNQRNCSVIIRNSSIFYLLNDIIKYNSRLIFFLLYYDNLQIQKSYSYAQHYNISTREERQRSELFRHQKEHLVEAPNDDQHKELVDLQHHTYHNPQSQHLPLDDLERQLE